MASLESLAAFLVERGMPGKVASIRREHVEAWLVDLAGDHSPATVRNRYTGVRMFFAWAEEEGELQESPMRHMKPPILPETEIPVLGPDKIASILATCDRKTFEGVRDAAIIATFYDCGLRLSELAGLRYSPNSDPSDIDLRERTIRVMGKGRKVRTVGMSDNLRPMLDRYVRERARRRDAHLPALWLGKKGNITASGIRQLVERRGELAGIQGLHPHQLRHSWAHYMLGEGEHQETDVMRLAGWNSRAMLGRYAASTGQQRAVKAHQRRSPLDAL
jgi:site-specific recombinase XerD